MHHQHDPRDREQSHCCGQFDRRYLSSPVSMIESIEVPLSSLDYVLPIQSHLDGLSQELVQAVFSLFQKPLPPSYPGIQALFRSSLVKCLVHLVRQMKTLSKPPESVVTALLHTSLFASDTPGEAAVPFLSSSLLSSLLNESQSMEPSIIE